MVNCKIYLFIHYSLVKSFSFFFLFIIVVSHLVTDISIHIHFRLLLKMFNIDSCEPTFLTEYLGINYHYSCKKIALAEFTWIINSTNILHVYGCTNSFHVFYPTFIFNIDNSVTMFLCTVPNFSYKYSFIYLFCLHLTPMNILYKDLSK